MSRCPRAAESAGAARPGNHLVKCLQQRRARRYATAALAGTSSASAGASPSRHAPGGGSAAVRWLRRLAARPLLAATVLVAVAATAGGR
jgi:hypothetical protein